MFCFDYFSLIWLQIGDKHEKNRFHAILHMAVLLGLSSLWAQVPTNTAVPLKSNYDYHDAFAPFFIQKMEQQHGPQAVNRCRILAK
jgi:hypothetical protein